MSYSITETLKYKSDTKNIIVDTLGYKLNITRKSKNIGLKQLAKILGVSCNTLNRWEKSETYPPLDYLPTLANTLDVPVNYLKDEYIEFIENLPSEINNLRDKLNLSAEDLAIKVGLNNPRTVREWCSGMHVPNTKVIKKLIQLKKAAG